MVESVVDKMALKRAKASQEIVHAQMALHEGLQAEERERAAAQRAQRASTGASGLGQHASSAQSPATANTWAESEVPKSPATANTRADIKVSHRVLRKLGSGQARLGTTREESNSSSSSSTSSSDDNGDDDIFPASMAGRVPKPGLSHSSSITVNGKRPTQTSLGEQALQTSQSMIRRVSEMGPSSTSSIARRVSPQHTESDVWLKVDVLDKESGGAEEEAIRSKLPTGSSVANLIIRGPESKPKRASNQLPPSQRGLLDRLERRFSSAGHAQPTLKSPSYVAGGSVFGGSLAGEPTHFSMVQQPNIPKSPSSVAGGSSVAGEHTHLRGGGSGKQGTPPGGPASERLSPHEHAHSSLPTILRPIGAQPPPTSSRQASLKSSTSTGTLGGGSPYLQKQQHPAFVRQSSKERSTVAKQPSKPSKPMVMSAMGSILQDA